MTESANFCFCTVASSNYIKHASGLYLNIHQLHPSITLMICALDKETERFFGSVGNQRISCVSAKNVWGPIEWQNLSERSSLRERAYASKPAIIKWALTDGGMKAALFLDCDMLMLSPINDVIRRCINGNILLTPNRHGFIAWRKSQNAGIFNAGLIGFSNRALDAVASWKAMCFELCTELPADGIYNEQIYLQYLAGSVQTEILDDSGLNVTPTIFHEAQPTRDDQEVWRTRDGVILRLVHITRATDPHLEFFILKEKADYEGFIALGGDTRDAALTRTGQDEVSRNPRWNFGSLFEKLQRTVMSFFRFFIVYYRIVANGRSKIFEIRQILNTRDVCAEKLWNEAASYRNRQKR